MPQVQRLDVGVNRLFKRRLRKLYADWMEEGGHQLTSAADIPESAGDGFGTRRGQSWKHRGT